MAIGKVLKETATSSVINASEAVHDTQNGVKSHQMALELVDTLVDDTQGDAYLANEAAALEAQRQARVQQAQAVLRTSDTTKSQRKGLLGKIVDSMDGAEK